MTTCALGAAAPAYAGGSGMPWVGPLQQIVESQYRARAVSPAGAAGLAQLMPGTAAEIGVTDRFDPEQNLFGGAAYLARQLVRFQDVRLALAAYNAGPARVAARGRPPPFVETQRYVTQVIDCYLALAAGREVRSARDCRINGGSHDPAR